MKECSEIKIPGYRIERTLGKGGMATVYLATQMSLGRAVALKVLNDPDTPQFFERFFNEGRFVSRLSHSNLVTIYDIGHVDSFYYIAMEYLPGGDLKTRILQGIKPGQAFKIVSRIASCLSYVHNEGVVHRDIKPSNILFRSDDSPVLTDFGIAKLMQMDNELTITGTILGSPHYLSPEQAQSSETLDGRSDLYSLGIILFEMLTGRKPYNANSFAATLMAHIKDPIPKLPEEFTDYQPIVEKLLAKYPGDRYQNGTELIMSIQQLRSRIRTKRQQAAESKQAAKPAPPNNDEPKRVDKSPRYGALLWGGVIGLVALTALAFIGSEDPPAMKPVVIIDEPPPPPATPEWPVVNVELPAAEAPVTLLEESAETDDETEEAPSEETPDEIEQLLAQAEDNLRRNRLTLPANNSASLYYNKVLAIEPNNPRALKGKVKIADRYARLARERLQKEHYGDTQRLITSGLKVIPKHKALRQLQQALDLALKPPLVEVEVEPVTVPVTEPPPPKKRRANWGFDVLTPSDRG